MNHEPIESRVKAYLPPGHGKTKKLMILVSSILVLTLITVFFMFKGSTSKSSNVQSKSIAVLPFKYLDNDSGKQYLAETMMHEINQNLSKIKGLRVISGTSVEQYRNSEISSKTIGHQPGVANLLKGSFKIDKDSVRLALELINTSDGTKVWSNKYDKDGKDILSVQREVAETVATELKAVITPKEKQLIRKLPTTDLTAYDFYQKGHYEYLKFMEDPCNWTALQKANNYYHKAL